MCDILFQKMADPRIWGGDLWASMHRFSLAYPERPTKKDQVAAYDLYRSIGFLLPCLGCQKHYQEYFKATFNKRKTTANRITLARWVYDLHEAVNRRLGKPVGTVNFFDLPTIYGAFPMRFIDNQGETLLAEPRYTMWGEKKCNECDKHIALKEHVAAVVKPPGPLVLREALAESQNTNGKPLSLAAILLIAVACIVFIALIAGLVVLVKDSLERKKQLHQQPETSAGQKDYYY